MGDLRRGKGRACWVLINSSLLAMRGSNLRSKASDPHLGLSYLPRLAQTWGRKEPKRACDRCGINSLSPEQTEAPGPLPTGISSPQSRGMFILWLEFIGCLSGLTRSRVLAFPSQLSAPPLAGWVCIYFEREAPPSSGNRKRVQYEKCSLQTPRV